MKYIIHLVRFFVAVFRDEQARLAYRRNKQRFLCDN